MEWNVTLQFLKEQLHFLLKINIFFQMFCLSEAYIRCGFFVVFFFCSAVYKLKIESKRLKYSQQMYNSCYEKL